MMPRAIRRIQRLAQQPLQPVTIQQLLARSASASNRDHVAHARWCRNEFPVRLAHRLNDFLKLPFVVICNSRFHEVFRLFLLAFDSLVDFEDIEDLETTERFAVTLRQLVRGHDEIVSMMQEGYGELQAVLEGRVELDTFLDQTFYTRIGNRVLAEHFLLVHEARRRGDLSCAGVVHPRCRPADTTAALGRSFSDLCSELYGVSPEVRVEGEVDTALSFVPEHLNFMLQELLKNAMRATTERHLALHGAASQVAMPPVTVEILRGRFDVTMKISDCGGGMTKEKLANVWKYGYSSAQDQATQGAGALDSLCGLDPNSMRQIAGYGFGLPLSRVYARYFGGDIHIETMAGYGTDVYLNVNHLDEGSAARARRRQGQGDASRGRLVAS
eukprot:TRINITY_DN23894_c0_g1_i1.p1 TRINITY_DN23894_c0_g1~~TRINITY_DN23894_c0_g1_i1.p1  ORF type:complete len:386 (+),score=77.53 TRINITY_DN23894_c0_g1_i1:91-1248(+)